MVLIVGWGGGVTQDLGEVAPTVCPRCHNSVFLHQITSNKQVSVYFVPLVPYESNAYLACPICHAGIRLAAGQIPSVDRMRGMTATFRHGAVDETAYRAAVDGFWASLGVAPSGDQVLHPSPTIPPPAGTARQPGSPPAAAPGSLADRLAGLAKLHANGHLTDEEFAAAKRRVLES
jgi:putative oligomerization/nucleic acid binding protein